MFKGYASWWSKCVGLFMNNIQKWFLIEMFGKKLPLYFNDYKCQDSAAKYQV